MAKKTISVNLFDQKSIDRAVKQIRQYQTELKSKVSLYVERLAETGIPVIDSNISAAKGDSDKDHKTHIEITSFGDYAQARLICEGESLLFIEFGAGIHYNGSAGSSPHPLGSGFGYTIGSYGKGQGANDYWFYYDDSGKSHMSHGTEATMPVYKASLEIRDKMIMIAKEVFGG